MWLSMSTTTAKMPPTEIIDLSLDTDEEDNPDIPRTVDPYKSRDPTITTTREEADANLNEWRDERTKRRRIGPSPVSSGDDLEVLANFVDSSRCGKITNPGSTTLKAFREVPAMSKRMEEQDPTMFKVTKAASSISKRLDDWDPIMISSSPHRDTGATRLNGKSTKGLSPMSDDLPEDALLLRGTVARQPSKSGSQMRKRTPDYLSDPKAMADLVKRLDPPRARMHDPREEKEPSRFVRYGLKRRQGDVLLDLPAVAMNINKKRKVADAEKEAKDEEKEFAKAEKARKKLKEREEEKERKRVAKEEKAREKQIAADLAEVNKAKTDKKTSTPEMIVDIPSSIEGKSIDTQIRGFLKNLQVETTSYDSPLPNIIKWRRKVTAQFNEEMGHWEPTQLEIRLERHVLCLLSAKEFVAMACANAAEVDGQDLEAHVLKFKSRYEDSILMYLIEGLEPWMRKNKNTRNRAYQTAVLSQMDGQAAEASTASKSRRKKPAEEYIDEDMVEDALLRLQVMHGCLIHHTAVTVESAEWVANFTQHISTIPYR